MPLLFHYTDRAGYNAIVASSPWRFRAGQPPGEHEVGAYFTRYDPPRPLYKLGIPAEKREYLFCFADLGDLRPIRGGRGAYVVYSPTDYEVGVSHQVYHGATADYPGAGP